MGPCVSVSLSNEAIRATHTGHLKRENQKLKSIIESKSGCVSIIANSKNMKHVVELAKRVSKSDTTVLINGESGTGKEVLAKLIHQSSNRADKPFITINCSAIPEALLESELFGHAKGSFTGALDKKIGLFEEANEGTLFLDEIGDLSLPLQAKLLRVIQEWKIKRVGENQYRDINVRLLSATHKNLSDEVVENRFREDLFFRLNVIPIHIPALRERKDDILPLAEYFKRIFRSRNNTKITGFSKDALYYMLKHEWKGNVRELENSIARATILCDSTLIEAKHLKFLSPVTESGHSTDLTEEEIKLILDTHSEELLTTDVVLPLLEKPKDIVDTNLPSGELLAVGEFISIDELELRYIKLVLNHTNGVKDHAAKILQVDRKTLYRKLEALEMDTIHP